MTDLCTFILNELLGFSFCVSSASWSPEGSVKHTIFLKFFIDLCGYCRSNCRNIQDIFDCCTVIAIYGAIDAKRKGKKRKSVNFVSHDYLQKCADQRQAPSKATVHKWRAVWSFQNDRLMSSTTCIQHSLRLTLSLQYIVNQKDISENVKNQYYFLSKQPRKLRGRQSL